MRPGDCDRTLHWRCLPLYRIPLRFRLNRVNRFSSPSFRVSSWRVRRGISNEACEPARVQGKVTTREEKRFAFLFEFRMSVLQKSVIILTGESFTFSWRVLKLIAILIKALREESDYRFCNAISLPTLFYRSPRSPPVTISFATMLA